MEKSLDKFKILEENFNIIKHNINESAIKAGTKAENIKFLAATKTVCPELINYAISLGVKFIGENKVQELMDKYDSINRKDCSVQFIGHLQTNKVKNIVGKVDLIQSVDSIKLANEISRLSIKNNIKTNVLVEVNIGNEKNKSGVSLNSLEELLINLSKIDFIKVCGLMTIPPANEEKKETEKYFSEIYKVFIDIKNKKLDNINMNILSMGMSQDYQEAIIHGSNMVRIGSALFGPRIYK